MSNQNDVGFNSMTALPNKLLQDDGVLTDITGTPVVSSSLAYDALPALPNKFLNYNGTYSTLNQIIASIVDTDLFIIVDTLPSVGKTSKIYLLRTDGGKFIEYIWTGTEWNPVGMVEFDLSKYSTTEQMTVAIAASLLEAKQYADTNFLKKNNTTAYTPTANYHPATKQYVDTKAVSFKPFPSEFITNQSTETFFESVLSISPVTGMVYLGGVSFTDMPEGLMNSEVELYVYPESVLYAVMRSADTSPYHWECNNFSFRGWEGIDKTAIDYTNTNFLNKTNTTAFTPTANYHPATKKYVDDAITNNITNALGGVY